MMIPRVTFQETTAEGAKGKQPNVYVFGLPRSGTSMMTKVLELLGVRMIYTSEDEKEKTDERFKQRFGEYHANPNGFFEITRNQFYNFMRLFERPYSGCKMIVPVNGIRWEIVTEFPSKVIFMTRDVEEIRQSQMAYYHPGDIDAAFLRTALVEQRMMLKQNKINFLEVDYNEALANVPRTVNRIAAFIDSRMDPAEAINFIRPDNHRFKREILTDGI